MLQRIAAVQEALDAISSIALGSYLERRVTTAIERRDCLIYGEPTTVFSRYC